jgi:signal transduction histidine kinase
VNLAHQLATRTGTAATTLLACVLGALLAADTAVTAAHHGHWVSELVVAATVCVLALLRAADRMLTASAGLAVCFAAAIASDLVHWQSQPGVAATAGLLVLGAAASRTTTLRRAAIMALGGVVVMVVGRFSLRAEYIVPFAFLGIVVWGCALGIGVWLRTQDTRRHLAIDAARRDERLELARELHDVVAHHITGIVVQAQAARLVANKRPETLPDTLAGIESAGNDALAAMRRVVGLLRDPEDTKSLTPGPEQLSELVDRFASQGPEVQLRLPDNRDADQVPWPPEIATTVYRIIQEALTNIVLHAPDAAHVEVSVDGDPTGIAVEVANDSPAGQPVLSWRTPSGGHGLVGMRERVEALGGTLHAGPTPHLGWIVQATLPLPTSRTR